MMDKEEQSVTFNCDECDTIVKGHDRFCYNCGAYLGYNAEQVSIYNNYQLRAAFIFYLIYLVVCLLVKSTSWFTSYDQIFWVEILLALVTIYFVRINRQALKPALKFKTFSFAVTGAVVLFAAVFAFVVNISMSKLNVSLFKTDNNLYDVYDMYQLPVLVMIYSVAVMPAIFEELAFRGVLYKYLESFLDERLVVMITGFAFAAMHLSFISLVWLIPMGIVLGALRKKYHTIWYGVIFHFIFNLTACLMDLYKEGMLW